VQNGLQAAMRERRIRHLLQGLRNQQWSKPWQQLQSASVRLCFFELQNELWPESFTWVSNLLPQVCNWTGP